MPSRPAANAVALPSSSTMTSSPLRSVPSESKSRPVATRRPATAVSRALKVGGAASGSDTLASSLARMSQ
ncbi:Uncharacterised protein [Mycobacterium tuberculosis]|uniref:Uncharacterized protein n=1 Tax=Mycobacterium tuberculosis TaxID=1773 RepID=A0A916PG65_MYCTX|nr:Uncharacterised protein [Mycobacterium tuberculosis]